MSCAWCEKCDGVSELEYKGEGLLVVVDDRLEIRPWNNGAGGPALRTSLDALPEGVETPCLATVDLYADTHPGVGGHLPEVLLEVAAVRPVAKVTTLVAGRQGWAYRTEGQRGMMLPVAGADSLSARQALNRAPCWVVIDRSEPTLGVFEDAKEFRESAAAAHASDEERAEQRRFDRLRAELGDDNTGFVNPYNFVPLGYGPRRFQPHGHLSLFDASGNGGAPRWSGRFSVTFTAVTPLALSGSGKGIQYDPHAPHTLHDGRVVLAGSAIAGAVRSFHEALTDSCLRVVDLDGLPVHRDPASVPDPTRQRMAVVVAPSAVKVCDPVVFRGMAYPSLWVEARHLATDQVDSSQRFHLDLDDVEMEVPDQRFRLEWVRGALPEPCTVANCNQRHWRTVVTSAMPDRVTNPRPGTNQHPYHLPFALEGAAGSQRPLTEKVLEAYRAAAQDAGDAVRQRRGDPVNLAVSNVGTRQPVNQTLDSGTVVWVTVELPSLTIERVSRSVLWRSPGEFPVRERVGPYAPCETPDDLCPSCALFGMAEERVKGTRTTRHLEAARSAAYRGHVRFGIAQVSDVQTEATRLKEMGSPRPGAGQFYLDNVGVHLVQAGNGQRPLREWGSQADRTSAGIRPIRGRKRYWTADGTASRHAAVQGVGNEQMVSFHLLSPTGTTVTATVTFDNVTTEQIGGLLVATSPELLKSPDAWTHVRALLPRTWVTHIEGQTLALHLGKGKGFGLGAVSSVIADFTAWGAERYAATPTMDAPKLSEAVAQFVKTLDAETAPGVKELVALSTAGWTPDRLVKYPPDDTPGPNFRFDFWKRSAGASGSWRRGNDTYRHEMVALPSASTDDPRVKRYWIEGRPS